MKLRDWIVRPAHAHAFGPTSLILGPQRGVSSNGGRQWVFSESTTVAGQHIGSTKLTWEYRLLVKLLPKGQEQEGAAGWAAPVAGGLLTHVVPVRSWMGRPTAELNVTGPEAYRFIGGATPPQLPVSIAGTSPGRTPPRALDLLTPPDSSEHFKQAGGGVVPRARAPLPPPVGPYMAALVRGENPTAAAVRLHTPALAHALHLHTHCTCT